MICPLYVDLRFYMFKEAESINHYFPYWSDSEKICMVSNYRLDKAVAKPCYAILKRRKRLPYN